MALTVTLTGTEETFCCLPPASAGGIEVPPKYGARFSALTISAAFFIHRYVEIGPLGQQDSLLSSKPAQAG